MWGVLAVLILPGVNETRGLSNGDFPTLGGNATCFQAEVILGGAKGTGDIPSLKV
jgi:hypothetical protein